jgi:adenylate cyclase
MILAGLSQVHAQAVNIGCAQEASLTKAREYADRALMLDPGSAQAHAARGMLCTLEGDYPAGVHHYRQAMAKDPGDVATWAWLAFLLVVTGKEDAAARLTEEALRRDPVDPNWHLLQAIEPLFRGEFAEASDRMSRAIRLAPDWPMFLFWRGLALAFAGRIPESLESLASLPSDPAEDVWMRLAQLLRSSLQGETKVFDHLLSEDFLPTVKRDGQNSWHVAGFQARLGRKEAALDGLENAVDRTFVPVTLFERDPFLAAVRDDPRFERILARARRIQASVPD